MNPAPIPPDLAYRFGLVVLGLCQVVANHVNRDCSNEPFIARIYFSLRRRLKRFERLFARAQAQLVFAGVPDHGAPGAEAFSAPAAGATFCPAAPAAKPASMAPSAERQKAERKPYERLPGRRGWLTTMIPYKAALYWYRLDDLLRDPEMVAFLAASREARRLLRPLWYSLCGDPLPACLREPPRAIPPEAFDAALVEATSDGGAQVNALRAAGGGDGHVDQQPPPGPARSRNAWMGVGARRPRRA